MTEKELIEIIETDTQAEWNFLRSDECPLSFKMILRAKPGTLAAAFADYRMFCEKVAMNRAADYILKVIGEDFDLANEVREL